MCHKQIYSAAILLGTHSLKVHSVLTVSETSFHKANKGSFDSVL